MEGAEHVAGIGDVGGGLPQEVHEHLLFVEIVRQRQDVKKHESSECSFEEIVEESVTVSRGSERPRRLPEGPEGLVQLQGVEEGADDDLGVFKGPGRNAE